jgi:eukaryotic-like serine/threonine-protein kinase
MTLREDVWPQFSDYSKAIRSPSAAFQGWPELAGGELRSGTIPGLPWTASGANAIVFSIRTTAGHQIAVRCFTRHPPNDVDERYRALGNFLATSPCPVFAGFQWTDHAIVVDDKRWPVLQMEWIDGKSLKAFVSDRVARPADIAQLSEK